jgi:thiol:disulfide interchange protein
MKRIIFTLVLFGLTHLSVFAQAEQTGIQFFEGTYEEALNKAAEENKLIFMDAYTTWCGPCKWMSRNTFTDASVADFFNENFINVKMDMERGEGPGLARKFRIRGYPTLLFLDAQGNIAHQKLGALPADQFLDLGKAAQTKL